MKLSERLKTAGVTARNAAQHAAPTLKTIARHAPEVLPTVIQAGQTLGREVSQRGGVRDSFGKWNTRAIAGALVVTAAETARNLSLEQAARNGPKPFDLGNAPPPSPVEQIADAAIKAALDAIPEGLSQLDARGLVAEFQSRLSGNAPAQPSDAEEAKILAAVDAALTPVVVAANGGHLRSDEEVSELSQTFAERFVASVAEHSEK